MNGEESKRLVKLLRDQSMATLKHVLCEGSEIAPLVFVNSTVEVTISIAGKTEKALVSRVTHTVE